MTKGRAPAKLAAEMQKLLPARLSVSSVRSRVEGKSASGTVRIYCSSDRKSFLSDFEAKLSSTGELTNLRIDGQDVKSRHFCED